MINNFIFIGKLNYKFKQPIEHDNHLNKQNNTW